MKNDKIRKCERTISVGQIAEKEEKRKCGEKRTHART